MHKNIFDKKVLLRDRKTRTAHGVSFPGRAEGAALSCLGEGYSLPFPFPLERTRDRTRGYLRRKDLGPETMGYLPPLGKDMGPATREGT